MTFSEYSSRLSAYRVEAADTDVALLDKHLPLLECFDQIERSSVALFDMSVLDYRFLTSRFRFLLGYNPEEARAVGMDFFFRRMNSYDMALFLDTSLKSHAFLASLPAAERKNYKTCQDFRIHRADDSWIRLIQQLITLELDRMGNVWLVLIVTDLSPLKDLDLPSRRYMENLADGERVLFPTDDAEAKSPLSPREMEILGLVSRGYHSRDIADYLGISVSTVNNHRQKILAKTNTANTAEAISFASRLNLIG